MSLHKLVLLGSLAALLGGCVVAPVPHAHRGHYDDRDYYYSDDDYYDYRNTPSYEGYYYVRVIFIGNDPYYVDDDRHVRPIPRHMHDHFRRSPFRNKDRQPPVFSREREVRDGYQMSRIIYLNDVPYYVEDGRVARPLPNHMHERFRHSPLAQDNRRNDNRPQGETGRRNDGPAYGNERERNQPPAYGNERERNQPPAYGNERERNQPPAYDNERERNQPPAYGNERERRESFNRNEPDRTESQGYGFERNRPQPATREEDPRRRRGGQPPREQHRFDASPFENSERTTPPVTRNGGRPELSPRVQPQQPRPDQRNAGDPRRNPPSMQRRSPQEPKRDNGDQERNADSDQQKRAKETKEKERDEEPGKSRGRD